MPLIYYRSHDDAEVSLWRATEGKEFFLRELEKVSFPTEGGEKIKHPEKALQWFASRYLLTIAYPDGIALYHDRKPFLLNGPAISFTHSEKVVGIMIAKGGAGIDIQKFDKKLEVIQSKFTDPTEIALCQTGDRLKDLSLLWTLKEAVFKYYGTGVPFKSIRLEKYDPIRDEARVTLSRSGQLITHVLCADFLNGMSLAYVLE